MRRELSFKVDSDWLHDLELGIYGKGTLFLGGF